MSLISSPVTVAECTPSYIVSDINTKRKNYTPRVHPYGRQRFSSNNDLPGTDETQTMKMWAVNASGHDFLINSQVRPDLISDVQHVNEHECEICNFRNDDDTQTLSDSMQEITARRDFQTAKKFLGHIAPSLATHDIITRHFNHISETHGNKYIQMVDNLLDVNYNIAMNLSREYAMMVTSNNTQIMVSNEKNLKGAAAAIGNIQKMLKMRLDLQKLNKPSQ